ncbi:MAG: asparagine synthetase B [Gemmatimonadota bacterium]
MIRRRDFLAGGAAFGAALVRRPHWIGAGLGRAAMFLVPMDDSQDDHLKAYGLAFRSLTRGERGEWLLNYRNGAFLLPASEAVQRDAALNGVTLERVDDLAVTLIRGEVQGGNMDAVPLEKVPKVAVYSPPDAAPWDDAVTMVLQYAGIGYDRVWDPEVIGNKLTQFDWLHLHHEDFTGQYSKFVVNYAGAPWLQTMMARNRETAQQLGFSSVPAAKRAVAQRIAAFVDRGGFLFAMCTATETLDLALASEGVDIAAAYADGTPMDPTASAQMHWDKALAFQGAALEQSPSLAVFSDIDGHQVNGVDKQALGAFTLFNFSAKIDPVATMLVQDHRQVIPDFYGLTTSFRRSRLKPGVTVLGDELGAPWVKYIHGEHGKGTWTFFGGHDPEDPQHAIGDAPTDLSLHPHSPGYRLILNNVLFPAARKKELKT